MKLPHLNYVRSFEASARLLSFTGAAEELNLSQAAVSGHIRSLEQFVGGALFERHARSLSLTTLGAAYLPTIQQSLSLIEAGTDSIVKRHDGRSVVISCPVTLAEGWLAEVLSEFSRQNPEISITVHGRIWNDEPPEVADFVIGNSRDEAMQPNEELVWNDYVVLCCAPDYQVDQQLLKAISQLNRARWIKVLSHTEIWQMVMESLGSRQIETGAESTYTSSFSTALALAREGHGVTVAPICYAHKFLVEGSLVQPLGSGCRAPFNTTITVPTAGATTAVRRAYAFILESAQRAAHIRFQ